MWDEAKGNSFESNTEYTRGASNDRLSITNFVNSQRVVLTNLLNWQIKDHHPLIQGSPFSFAVFDDGATKFAVFRDGILELRFICWWNYCIAQYTIVRLQSW